MTDTTQQHVASSTVTPQVVEPAARRHTWSPSAPEHEIVMVSPQHFVDALTVSGSVVGGGSQAYPFGSQHDQQYAQAYQSAVSVPLHYAAAAPYAPTTGGSPLVVAAAQPMIRPLSHRDGALGLMLGLMVLVLPMSGAAAMIAMEKTKVTATPAASTAAVTQPVANQTTMTQPAAAPTPPQAPVAPTVGVAATDPGKDAAAKDAAAKAALAKARSSRREMAHVSTTAKQQAAAKAAYADRVAAYNAQKSAWDKAHAAGAGSAAGGGGSTGGASGAGTSSGGSMSGMAGMGTSGGSSGAQPTPTPQQPATSTGSS